MVGDRPLLGDGDYADQLRRPRAGLVGDRWYLPIDLHRVDHDRRHPSLICLRELLGKSIGEVALASGRGAADDDGLSSRERQCGVPNGFPA